MSKLEIEVEYDPDSCPVAVTIAPVGSREIGNPSEADRLAVAIMKADDLMVHTRAEGGRGGGRVVREYRQRKNIGWAPL